MWATERVWLVMTYFHSPLLGISTGYRSNHISCKCCSVCSEFQDTWWGWLGWVKQFHFSTIHWFYCATPNNLCFYTTWKNRETRKLHFFTQMLYQCIARIQLVPPLFLQAFWLMTHTHAAVWLPKSCNQCIQLWLLGGMVQEKGSREHRSSWTVLHAQCMCTSALSFWKKKMSSVMCLIALIS